MRMMAGPALPPGASEARLREFYAGASDWFWETDAALRLRFVSRQFYDMPGLASAAVDGLAFADLVQLGFDRGGMAELCTVMAAEGSFCDAVHRIVLAGGKTRFWRLSGRPFSNPATGAFAGYLGTGSDVTAAIEQAAALNASMQRAEAAEREAHAARQWLADAIEVIPEGIVLFDAEARLVLCNAAYKEIYPRTADLMTPGASFADILRASALRGEHVLAGQDLDDWVAERMARHHASSGNREEQRLADGRRLQVSERRTSDGGTVGIRVDVTEAHRRAEAERQREKLAALGHLAGGVAHEINNLLQPALTLPQLVRDRLPPDDVDSREDLDCVLENVRKMREVVRNILLFSRQEEPRLVPLDLVAELRAALDFVRGLIPANVTVIEAAEPDAHRGCLVAASKTQLTQVLTNLLVNAAQAIRGTGTVTVTVARIEPTATEAAGLAIETGRSYLAVSITDTGSGMDEATQARIFEPFFTTKPVGEGTGLGLSVVYGIVRGWQGAITVRSAPGLGTTFVLIVPILSARAEGGTQSNIGLTGIAQRFHADKIARES